ncbi:MAG TPA: Ldh family oxidoreductase [Stellaceae bacterium]|nr:Ldh family oxidoreductase [Stellaceae bacterium]
MIRLAVNDIRQTSITALSRAGVPAPHAETQVDLLLEAELRGRPSHGLLRLPRVIERIHNGVCDPVTQGRHEWRSSNFLDVDGGMGLGPVVAKAALAALAPRAKETGIAIAAIRNNNHLGMLGWYAEAVAKAGQIALLLTTSEALVHPWGGRQAMLGTNPIAIGMPADPGPFVLDMATGLVSMGQIHDHAQRDEPIPVHWALDAEGNPTTDAHAAKLGSIAPFGAAKGYALGLAFEVLVTALSGAAIGRDVKGTLDSTAICNKGDVFIVIEAPMTEHLGMVGAYLEELRHSPSAHPGELIAVPGDRGRRIRALSAENGVTLPEALWQTINDLAKGAAA